ncbi:hypothetical protein [Aquibium sp. ELW1220]|uniref:hypothetical protein n=1 Tax=Aquibium sp. ELW1220 TaxID=2976766 RepID=UPI0025B19D1A|nr:hypothetical protein [Aquibium sp. ELW1220]MDN2583964.1 hypothetical protein [Aquibium sp. ELW1220]
MIRRLLFAVLIGLVLFRPLIAKATSIDEFTGYWRQVSSNAGSCDCSLSVRRDGVHYHVVASNGWEAAAIRVPAAGLVAYAGDGRWERSAPRIGAGRRIAAHFIVGDGRLHLTLMLTRPDGSPWRVDAEFEREVPVS